MVTAAPFSTVPVAFGVGSSVNGATAGGSNVASRFGTIWEALGSTANITISLVGVGLNIQVGLVAVNSGTFVIDSTTIGSIDLNSGTFAATGVALTNPVNSVVDLSTEPTNDLFLASLALL